MKKANPLSPVLPKTENIIKFVVHSYMLTSCTQFSIYSSNHTICYTKMLSFICNKFWVNESFFMSYKICQNHLNRPSLNLCQLVPWNIFLHIIYSILCLSILIVATFILFIFCHCLTLSTMIYSWSKTFCKSCILTL